MIVYSLPATLPESIATVSGTHSSIRIVSARVAQWLEHSPPYHVCRLFTPQYLHICKEQICAYPCFRPVPPMLVQRISAILQVNRALYDNTSTNTMNLG